MTSQDSNTAEQLSVKVEEPAVDAVPTDPWYERHFEIIIALLLGLASIITAWASYQASLYDGEMASANTKAGVLAAEAESAYLEGNQQWMSDSQFFDRITELEIESNSVDTAAAKVAAEVLEVLIFQSMTEDFAAALEWSIAENEADPEMFTHPQNNEDYQAVLFGGYQELKAEADAALETSSSYNELGDQLTLATVLLAISLFLFGIAAILRRGLTRLVNTGVATVIMVAATVLSIVVVSTPVS